MIIDQTSLLTRLPQEWGLNSRGLKRICSDSSSWTFGIQGENSMKSRDEIVIIMLQWLRLYTLGSRGSRELKNFLETRLISSRVDQKLKNKEGVHEFLKRKLALNRGSLERSWSRFASVMEAVSFAWLCGFKSASILTGFHGQKASNFHDFSTTIGPRSSHDRVTIGLRSWS